MLLKILRGTAIVLALISITKAVNAQTSTNFDLTSPTKVYTPSDNAASFVQIKDLPVSFYTGTPQVSFELFKVKAGSLSHTVSISNSGGAIRVEDEGGPLGLNWSLNVGGAITRSIVGTNDEAGSLAGYTGSAGYLGLPLYSTQNPTDWLSTLTMCNKKDLSDGKYELTPDIYNLSFNGKSAKMFFDRTGKAYFSPYQAWKVSGSVNSGFIVVTEDGTRYEFGSIESSTHVSDNTASDAGSIVTGKSAWYLSRIISNNFKDTILFNYIPVTFSQDEKIPGESRYNLMPDQVSNPCGNGIAEQQKIATTYTTHSTSTYLLSNIAYAAGKIDFVLTQDRTDTDGNTYRYREMNVYNRTSSGTYSLIRKFTFNQSNSNPSATSVMEKRMLLNSFVEYGGGDSLKHSFTYITPNLLPAKNSKSQDHWGFYNGKNNTTLIAAFDDGGHGLSFSGANREPDSASMQIGLLESITYPLGGTVTFTYEPHYYSFKDGISIYERQHLDSTVGSGNVVATTAGAPTSIFRDTTVFVMPNNIYNSDVSASFRITGPNPSDPPADVYIYSSNWTLLFAASTSQGVSMPITTVTWEPGKTYYLIASRDNSSYTALINLVHKKWTYYIAPSLFKKMAGGTRVRAIRLYDGINHFNDVAKRFIYELNDSTSSGNLVDLPKYEGYQYTPIYCPVNGQPLKSGDWLYFTRHASSLIPLSRTQGSVVGYGKVVALQGDDVDNSNIAAKPIGNADNGWEEFTYSIFGDAGGNGYPYIPRSSREELRGLLLQHKVFTSTGNLVKSTTNEYNYNNTPGSPNYRWIWGAKYGTRRSSNMILNGCPDESWEFLGGMYNIYQFWPTLKSKADTTYDMVTGAAIGVKTNYYYDSTNLQVIQEDFINSENVTVATQYRYPKNFAGTAVYDSMLARNMVNTVIEKTITRGGVQSSKEKTNFGFFNGFIAPSSFQLAQGPGNLQTRLLYHRYDTYGNLLEQGKSNDIREIYVWGYNNEYPIAKISGSTATAVNAIVLNTNVLQNPSSDAALRTEITKIRNGLAGSVAQVTTFTFSPQVGTTSETDASGKVTFYEYDGLGRLKIVKDHDGKVLKTFEYKIMQPITQ